jgi:integrin beta 3
MSLDLDALADLLVSTVDRAIAPYRARLEAAEIRATTAETARAAVEVALEAYRTRLEASLERLAGLEARVDGLTPVVETVATVRERVAALETRPPVPGPPGPAGRDGQDGRDGAGFDDLAVDLEDRTFTVRVGSGDRVKAFPFELPFLKWVGVYREGTAYQVGDVVTWYGALWHCRAATLESPTERSTVWALIVKRGRDGRDGRDGPAGPPGPRGRDWEQTIDALRAS